MTTSRRVPSKVEAAIISTLTPASWDGIYSIPSMCGSVVFDYETEKTGPYGYSIDSNESSVLLVSKPEDTKEHLSNCLKAINSEHEDMLAIDEPLISPEFLVDGGAKSVRLVTMVPNGSKLSVEAYSSGMNPVDYIDGEDDYYRYEDDDDYSSAIYDMEERKRETYAYYKSRSKYAKQTRDADINSLDTPNLQCYVAPITEGLTAVCYVGRSYSSYTQDSYFNIWDVLEVCSKTKRSVLLSCNFYTPVGGRTQYSQNTTCGFIMAVSGKKANKHKKFVTDRFHVHTQLGVNYNMGSHDVMFMMLTPKDTKG